MKPLRLFQEKRPSGDFNRKTIKKASEANVDDLGLDYHTRRRLINGVLSVDELIKRSRDNYFQRFGGRVLYRSWPDNVISSLDRAGFIRHDIDKRTFLVGRFYRRVFVMAGLDHSRIFTKYEDLSDNATYEMCQVVTDDFFFGLLEYIELVLGRKEARIIELLFGFEDGNIYNNNQVGEMYGVTGQRIRQLSRIYLRKLAEEGLPPLQYPS